MHILGTYYMFPIKYLLISYCIDIYQGITNFVFYSETNNLENLEESLINQILKPSQNLYIIHYVALSTLNCREGHRFTHSNMDCNSHTIDSVSLGIKKPLFTKVLTLMHICIVLGLMWGALHMLSHLIPQTLHRAKSSIKHRYIRFQRSQPCCQSMMPLQRKNLCQ